VATALAGLAAAAAAAPAVHPLPGGKVDIAVIAGPTTLRAQVSAVAGIASRAQVAAVGLVQGDGKAAGNVQGNGKAAGPTLVNRSP
jgi:hypothetical protein